MRNTDAILDCVGEYQEAAADMAARFIGGATAEAQEAEQLGALLPDPWEYTKTLLGSGELNAW